MRAQSAHLAALLALLINLNPPWTPATEQTVKRSQRTKRDAPRARRGILQQNNSDDDHQTGVCPKEDRPREDVDGREKLEDRQTAYQREQESEEKQNVFRISWDRERG